MTQTLIRSHPASDARENITLFSVMIFGSGGFIIFFAVGLSALVVSVVGHPHDGFGYLWEHRLFLGVCLFALFGMAIQGLRLMVFRLLSGRSLYKTVAMGMPAMPKNPLAVALLIPGDMDLVVQVALAAAVVILLGS